MKKATVTYFLIVSLVVLPLIIDQLNGFIKVELGKDFSISQLFKSVISALLLLTLLTASPTRFLYLICFIVLMPISLLINFFVDSSRLSYALDDLIFFTKLITFPLSYLFFNWIFTNYRGFLASRFRRLYLFLCVFFFACILVSPLGLGISQYGMTEGGVSFGYRGYFIAGNEVSALFILLFAFWVFDLYYFQKNTWFTIVGILVGLVTAGLIVTKTTLIAALLLFLSVPILLTIYERRTSLAARYLSKFLQVLITVFILSISILVTVFRDKIDANIDRFEENYQRADNFGNFLLSGRDDRFNDSKELFNSYSLPEKLFGTGWNYPQQRIHEQMNGWGSSEVDYLDILVSNGIIGLALIYLFWAGVYFRICKALFVRRNVYTVPLFLSFSIIFLNSFLSGHILYSALLGHYLGFFAAIIILSKKELCTS